MSKKNEPIAQKNDKAIINPIDQIDLQPEQIKKILIEASVKEGVKLFPGFGKVLSIADNISQELKQAQLSVLLQKYGVRFENIEEAQAQLMNLFSSKAGMILFQKFVHILNKGDLDERWLELLSGALKNISNLDFQEQFDRYSYLLSQLEQLSAQSLLLLNEFSVWGGIKFTGSTTMSGQTIVGDRHDQLMRVVISSKSIKDTVVKENIKHAFNDLESKGMFYVTEQKGVALSYTGSELLDFVN